MDIIFDENDCQNLREALRKEWLETNGIGGYASSTILNCHSRKYHGWLVAGLANPPGRFVLLSKIEESAVAEEKEYFFSCNKYPGIFQPHGHRHLAEVRLGRFPNFVYQVGDCRIHRSIMMIHGRNTVLIRYAVEHCSTPFTFRLHPLLAFRGHHELSKENVFLQVRTFPIKFGFKIQPYNGLPPLHVSTSIRPRFYPSPVWYRNFEYVIEQERGYDAHEDLFHPGLFEMPMKDQSVLIVAASVEEETEDLEDLWKAEDKRRAAEETRDAAAAASLVLAPERDAAATLVRSSRHFLVRLPKERPAIIAGYPWFDDWGRDTLISLPGLTFCLGRMEEGSAVLAEVGRHEKHGLIPNCFGSGGRNNAYNSVDASLWYFWAVQQMLKYGGRKETVRKSLWPVMKRILRHYMDGTDHGIGMGSNGLLHAGDANTQLTWMDAKVAGVPVTPRHGCAVDINALWYNAVCFACQFAADISDASLKMSELPPRIAAAFRETFWIEFGRYLGDVFTDWTLDTAVRPNQILAVSLPFSPLDAAQSAGVVECVKENLLTPYGLRTLSPRNESYRGRYAGSPESRDAAYHQGTVWPWLLGHFGEAALRVSGNRSATRRFLTETIEPLLGRHLRAAGIGCVSEVFDGDPPHAPNGCIAQAWSVAELIRLLRVLNEPRD